MTPRPSPSFFICATALALGAGVLVVASVGCSGADSGTLVPTGGGSGERDVPSTWPHANVSDGVIDARSCSDGSSTPTAIAPRCASGVPAFALAVCGDLAADNTMTLEARAASGAASLAVNGRSRTAAPIRIAGSFTTLLGNEANNTQDVDGDLRTAGDWTSSSPARIGRDAFVGGLFTPKNTVSIGGTLHVAAMVDPSVPNGVTAASVVRGPVSVPAPLDCAGAPDVGALVAAQPAEYLVSRDALVRVGSRTRLLLGCDRYRFSAIAVESDLTIEVEGNAVIVVEGNLRIAAPTRIDLGPGASLELVIGGSLEIDNTLTIGGRGSAWVGVGGNVRVAAPTTLDGWLVAPTSSVALDNTLGLTGAAYVGNLRVASPLVVRPGGAVTANGCASP